MKLPAFSIVILFLISCTPRVHYLGDTYAQNPDDPDVYYDEGDVKKNYKVIGQLSSDSVDAIVSLDKIKETMILSAKQRGADGILFISSDSFGNDHFVKAKLLKYL